MCKCMGIKNHLTTQHLIVKDETDVSILCSLYLYLNDQFYDKHVVFNFWRHGGKNQLNCATYGVHTVYTDGRHFSGVCDTRLIEMNEYISK